MDATFSAIVGGFFTVICVLIGGIAHIDGRGNAMAETARANHLKLLEKIHELEDKLDKQYLLRGPHIEKHKAIEGRLDEHGGRIRALEDDVRALKGLRGST